MDRDRFDELIADRVDRIERAPWILEDVCDPVAANPSQPIVVRLEKRLPVEFDAPADDVGRRLREDAGQGLAGDALAAAGLADETDRLAAADLEADAVDGADRFPLGPDVCAKVVDR